MSTTDELLANNERYVASFKRDNHVFDWESGDRAATDRAFARAQVVVEQDMLYPRVHPAKMETCGAVADFGRVSRKLTLWCTSQAPHAHRTVCALACGLPEHMIRVISPDIGGGFGNKVPVYPGYLCAIVGSIVTGRPVKWTEDRSENLMSPGFARDYVMKGAIAGRRDGRITALRVDVIADHGAFNATAQPSKHPAAIASATAKILAKAQLLAGMALDTPPDTLKWAGGAFVSVNGGDATQVKTIEDIALNAHRSGALPPGVEGGLDAQTVYRD